MVPRKKRNPSARKKNRGAPPAGRRAGSAPAPPQQRWLKAIGAGTLLLSPLTLTAGSPDGWLSPAHTVSFPAGVSQPDPQYGFGFIEGQSGIGATGVKARSSRPSAGVFRRAGNLAAHTSQPGLPLGRLGIPGTVLRAYLRAQQIMASQQPGCHLPWWLVAGIGKVESDHADGGLVNAQGDTLVPILGPALNGTNGFAAITAAGGGWERAEGPMQFLPSTWQEFGGGGNPNNVYDAALAAGRYLCAGGRNLSGAAGQAGAVFSYNPSDSYVQTVLTWAYAYASGVIPVTSAALPSGFGTPGAGPAAGGPGSSGTGSGRHGSGGHGSGGHGSSGTASSGSGGSTGSTGSGSGGSSSPVGSSPVPAPSRPSLPLPTGAPVPPVKGLTGAKAGLPSTSP
jgi:hypothetical protein